MQLLQKPGTERMPTPGLLLEPYPRFPELAFLLVQGLGFRLPSKVQGWGFCRLKAFRLKGFSCLRDLV